MQVLFLDLNSQELSNFNFFANKFLLDNCEEAKAKIEDILKEKTKYCTLDSVYRIIVNNEKICNVQYNSESNKLDLYCITYKSDHNELNSDLYFVDTNKIKELNEMIDCFEDRVMKNEASGIDLQVMDYDFDNLKSKLLDFLELCNVEIYGKNDFLQTIVVNNHYVFEYTARNKKMCRLFYATKESLDCCFM